MPSSIREVISKAMGGLLFAALMLTVIFAAALL